MAQVTNLELFKALGLPGELYPVLGKSEELRAYLETLSADDLFKLFDYKRDILPPAAFAMIKIVLWGKMNELSMGQRWICYQQSAEGSTTRETAEDSLAAEILAMQEVVLRSPVSAIVQCPGPLALLIVQKMLTQITQIPADIDQVFAIASLSEAATSYTTIVNGSVASAKKKKKAKPQVETPPTRNYADEIRTMITEAIMPILKRLPDNGADGLSRAFCQTRGRVQTLATKELENRLRDCPPFSLWSEAEFKRYPYNFDLLTIFQPHLTTLSLEHIVNLWEILPVSAERHLHASEETLAGRLTKLTIRKLNEFSADQLATLADMTTVREALGTLPADTLGLKLESGPALVHAQYFMRIFNRLQTPYLQLVAVEKLRAHISLDPNISQEDVNAKLNSLASDERIRRIFANSAMPRDPA